VLYRVFEEYVITWLWVRAGSYYIGYLSSWTDGGEEPMADKDGKVTSEKELTEGE